MRDFVLGQVPASAREDVPLQKFDADSLLVALVTTDDGGRASQDFRRVELDGGKVMFHDKTVTLREFDTKTSCG